MVNFLPYSNWPTTSARNALYKAPPGVSAEQQDTHVSLIPSVIEMPARNIASLGPRRYLGVKGRTSASTEATPLVNQLAVSRVEADNRTRRALQTCVMLANASIQNTTTLQGLPLAPLSTAS
jgi:hypothetical protein